MTATYICVSYKFLVHIVCSRNLKCCIHWGVNFPWVWFHVLSVFPAAIKGHSVWAESCVGTNNILWINNLHQYPQSKGVEHCYCFLRYVRFVKKSLFSFVAVGIMLVITSHFLIYLQEKNSLCLWVGDSALCVHYMSN